MPKKKDGDFECVHIGHYKAGGQAIVATPGKPEATIITTLFCEKCGKITHNLSPIKLPRLNLAVPTASVFPAKK